MEQLDSYAKVSTQAQQKQVQQKQAKAATSIESTTPISMSRNQRKQANKQATKAANSINKSTEKSNGREAKIKGSELLPAVSPPNALRIWNGDTDLGYAIKIELKNKDQTKVLIFPKHFYDGQTEPQLTWSSLTSSERKPVIRANVSFSSKFDYCIYTHHDAVNAVKLTPIGNLSNEITPHITVNRNGTWFNSVSTILFNPKTQTDPHNEAIYSCASEAGDCGLPVMHGGCAYGVHVGTRGDYDGNLFLRFNPAFAADLLTVYGTH